MPSVIRQPRSTTTFFSRACRATSTAGSSTAPSTVQYELIRTRENSTERDTREPEMMQPPETIESTAVPRRSSWSNTNLAGGSCSWYVQIGHSASYMSSAGVGVVRSMLADQYASTVPTSRQYGSASSAPTHESLNGCAAASFCLTIFGMMSLPKSCDDP